MGPPRVVALLVGVAMLVAPAGADAQVTRDQAKAKVMALVTPASLDHSVRAFLVKAPLAAGTTVASFDDPAEVRTLAAGTWFAWIDDAPLAFFEHETRFVFIDATSGATEVVQELWWPVIDGVSQFMDDAAWTDAELIVYSCVNVHPLGGTP